MPKRKTVKKIVKATKSKSKFNLKTIFLLAIVVVPLLIWSVYRSLLAPSDINLVATDLKIRPGTTTESGCFYKQVKCFQAPCEPILVCPAGVTPPSPSTTPNCKMGCPMIARPPADWCANGTVVSKGVSECGCELPGECVPKASISPKPTPSCIPNPCPPGAECTTVMPPGDTVYCPTTTSKPTRSPLISTVTPSTTPSPGTSSCKSQIVSLAMKDQCSSNGFALASYKCSVEQGSLTINGCMDATEIYKQVQAICGYNCPGKSEPTPVPPTMCKKETGFCVTDYTAGNKVCTNYTDSCQKAKICLPQYINESCE